MATVRANQRSFSLTIQIDRPVPIVYAHLANPANLLGLQPLLTQMSPIQETIENQQRVYRYETIETFRVAGIPLLHNRIRVQTVLTEENLQMVSVVHSAPRLKLHVVYDFQPCGEGTILTESMRITGHPWLLSWVVAQATSVQQRTLANLKARLETAKESGKGARA
jgi:hypothetical protein